MSYNIHNGAVHTFRAGFTTGLEISEHLLGAAVWIFLNTRMSHVDVFSANSPGSPYVLEIPSRLRYEGYQITWHRHLTFSRRSSPESFRGLT